jgi:hypothetical protein
VSESKSPPSSPQHQHIPSTTVNPREIARESLREEQPIPLVISVYISRDLIYFPRDRCRIFQWTVDKLVLCFGGRRHCC